MPRRVKEQGARALPRSVSRRNTDFDKLLSDKDFDRLLRKPVALADARPNNRRYNPGNPHPFVPRPPRSIGNKRAAVQLARSFPRPRVLPLLDAILLLGDVVDGVKVGIPTRPGFPNPAEWWHRHGPNTYAYPYAAGPLHQQQIIYRQTGAQGPETGKITAQASVAGQPIVGAPVPSSWTQLGVWRESTDPTLHRSAQVHAFEKLTVATVPAGQSAKDTWPKMGKFVPVGVNANDLRALPSPAPAPVEVPVKPAPVPLLQAMADAVAGREVATETLTFPVGIGIGSGSSRNKPPIVPHARTPPKKRVREGKSMSKSAQVAIHLFKALDNASELSEIVDGIYQALPPSVRKRAEERHKNDGAHRRMLDQAGQYGIGGVDWKMRTIYENWGKLNVNDAWKNIAKNLIEDQMHGFMHKNRTRNHINATEEGDKLFGQLVNDLLDGVFGP